MKKTLYLSGPMTGIPNLNRELFNAVAKKLRQKGYRVVNPPELDNNEPRQSWKECLQRDIMHLMNCDEVATLPRWKNSRGATLEVYIAKALNYPVHRANYYL